MIRAFTREQNGGPSVEGKRNYGTLSKNLPNIARERAGADGPDGLARKAKIEWPAGKGRAAYVLLLLTLLNTTNKMDRFVLIEVVKEMANDLEFGDRSCLNSTVVINQHVDVEESAQYTCNSQSCEQDSDGRIDVEPSGCHWIYWGTGLEYQLMAGPAFIVVIGLMRVPLTFLMDHGRINGRNIVVACAVVWSLATLLTGFATRGWHVVVCRTLLGVFQAPFSPFSIALTTAYFPPQLRGLALSVLNSGIALGYASAYGLGFVQALAGWRWAYWSASISGLLVATIMLCTLQNPTQLIQKQTTQSLGEMSRYELLGFLNWVIIIPLSLGSALRFGASYIFNYNFNNYLLHYYPHFPVYIYLSWTPVLSGLVGIVFSGLLSDLARKRHGVEGRLFMVIAVSVGCIPIVALIFFLEPPSVFAAMAIGISMSDSWTAGTISTLSEFIPPTLRPSFFAVFYCLINTAGGTINMSLPALRRVLHFRFAMLMGVVGLISAGTALFAVGFVAMLWSRHRQSKYVDLDENANVDEEDNQNRDAHSSTTPPLIT